MLRVRGPCLTAVRQQQVARRTTDAEGAKIFSQRFKHTKSWRHVDADKKVRLKGDVRRTLNELGSSVGVKTYAAAISVIGRVGMSQTVDELWEESKHLRQKALQARSTDPNMHNALLHARLSKTKDADEVKAVTTSLFSLMSKDRVYPDLYTFNIALKGAARWALLPACQKMLCTMQNRRIHPDLVTFNTLLSGSTPETVQTVMKQMQKAGHRPNAKSYTAVISVYCKARHCAGAVLWFEKALGEKQATVRDVVNVMKALLYAENPAKSLEIMRSALAGGIAADSEVYHVGMLCHSKLRDFASTASLYREMIAGDVPVSYRTYSIFIDAVCSAVAEPSNTAERVRQLVTVAESALTAGLQKNACSNSQPFEALARVYHRVGDAAKLEKLAKNYAQSPKLPPSEEIARLLAESRSST
ncbi:Protein Rf1 [Diplonema papillatum]|nr:Protein Rf1 [Diplonema papillatum]